MSFNMRYEFPYSVGRDSVVGIATHYGLDGPGIEFRISAPVQTGPGAHSTSYTTRTGSFTAVKRPARRVDHSFYLAPRLQI